jgi:predicted transcriptional regulator of viral defense system
VIPTPERYREPKCRHILVGADVLGYSPVMERPGGEVNPANLSELGAVFRARDVEALGIPRSQLRAWLRSGTAERVGRGLYRSSHAEPSEHETLAMVAARAPQAVICLLTALRVHGIGTQAPREVWIALDRKARKPQLGGLPVHVVRFSGPMLSYAVQTREIQGVPVRITSPARTVVDCFRYRNKIGLDVALEALRDALASGRASVAEILRIAEVGRVLSVIQPYVEAAVS